MEIVIGLEIHAELATRTKLFCGCENRAGAAPNTLCCPICAGLPGAMPSLNAEAVRLAIRAGLALNCEIFAESAFDRKHYFYPDLPKGYQITQYFRPICGRGSLRYTVDGVEKELGITRIHLEEDAGKLFHGEGETLLDLNRCGVPLIEIVTEPQLRSPAEAAAAFRELHRLLVFAGVTLGRMNEGNLRCDANLSLHECGTPFGSRCEIKNINSFSILEKACRAEVRRQEALLSAGKSVEMMTLRFDGERTIPMRRKETPDDYRYLPEPDLPPLLLSPNEIEQVRAQMPPLPPALTAAWQAEYGLSLQDASLLCKSPETAQAFLRAAHGLSAAAARTAAHLLTGEVAAEQAALGQEDALPFAPERLGELAALQEEGRINATTAKKLAAELVRYGDALLPADESMAQYAECQNLTLLTDAAQLRKLAHQAISENPAMAEQYRAGKMKLLPALLGKAMALSRGRADALRLEKALKDELGNG